MVHQIDQLVHDLDLASKSSNSKGRPIQRKFFIKNSSGMEIPITSWKFNEWDYEKQHKIKLLSLARGLFTMKCEDGHYRVVCRGYDKFFAVDETSMTKWSKICEDTVGPYEVSLKENGCILLISGLNDGTLVVCSKHSVGNRDDLTRNHATSGEKFLRAQLDNDENLLRELALTLYHNNYTAVAEYCDDSFEEHILEYDGNNAGLYLHGLNHNVENFVTESLDKVDEFADKWGFKKVRHFSEPALSGLLEFFEKCKLTGSFEGKEIEGFVIRCHYKDTNSPFLFKYKFEEPYLMYRQWREATKDYIKSGNKVRPFKFPKHKFITNKYLDFVCPILDKDCELCERYLQNFGIIKLRKLFLESYGMSGIEVLNLGKVEELNKQNAIDRGLIDKKTKFLIVPVSVIGSGKTLIANILTILFSDTWGHIQNDDIRGKDKSKLIQKSLELLQTKKCVIVDRNNHQFLHRKQIFDWISEFKEDYLPYDTNIQVIAAPFIDRDVINEVAKQNVERIIERGDNHQTIKLSKGGVKKIRGIMNSFVKSFQPLNTSVLPDCQFDYVIKGINVLQTNPSLENSKIIVGKIHERYPILIPNIPTDEEFDKAFKTCLSVRNKRAELGQNEGVQNDKGKVGKKKLSPVYFSANIEDTAQVCTAIYRLLRTSNLNDNDVIHKLFTNGKLKTPFHVTLSHVSGSKKGSDLEKKIWLHYNEVYKDAIVHASLSGKTKPVIQSQDYLSIELKKLLWDDKIATILVNIVNDKCVSHENSDGNNFLEKGLNCCNKYPHITVGILTEGVAPYYSNTLAMQYYSNTSKTDIECLEFPDPLPTIRAKVVINF
ncbi:tRNA ligase SCDLUD_003680 [Saccharomycodes ludwigii]|uniref:tRNA ligase n=1 Tax=Saccharomycodes ludwigii TaxID=36035 RepID=UPI001E8A0AD6|nr:hypothetical protein SCDLUD_003680 [Saccharomycodes ludwigii]KAH3900681.1 hypothetical protein SCDLUD_003680 [Saccharomycodes ludwigii]